MSLVTRKLIAKELYVNRWTIISVVVGGVVAALMASLGETAFNVAALTWLTVLIAGGVMLAIYGVQNERKENSLQFVLSLPISIPEYVRAKVFGLLLSFAIPWAIVSLAAVGMVLFTEVPDGLLPYLILLSLYLLTNFGTVLCGAMHARSEALVVAVIILTNMSVSLWMSLVGTLPGLQDHIRAAQPAWNDTFFNVLSVQLILFVVVITLPLATAARRRDFI